MNICPACSRAAGWTHVCLPPQPPTWSYGVPVNNKPYACPICNGKGEVGPRFYEGWRGDDPKEDPRPPVQCRSCFGRGILWG